MKYILLFFLLIGIIILIVVIYRYKTTRIEYINCAVGVVGGGKTSFNICRIIRLLRQVYFLFRNGSVKHDYIILSQMPFGLKDKKKKCRYVRIFGHIIYCYKLDPDILLLKKRLPQDEVIIDIPEFHNFCDSLDYRNPTIRDNLSEFFANFRHYTNGKGYIFLDTQRLGKVNINIRGCLDYCYNMISTKKIFLLPLVRYEYIKILVNENVSNQISVEDATQETYISKTLCFCNPFKYYNSYVYHERYLTLNPVAELTTILDDFVLPLFKNPYSKPLYYDLLKYDFVATPFRSSEELYLDYCKGIK